MKLLDEPSKFRIFRLQRNCCQVAEGQWPKRIPGLVGVLILLCLAAIKPALAEDAENIVWTTKAMAVSASANNQYDPPNGDVRQSTEMPVSAYINTPKTYGGATSWALSGGPGMRGETFCVRTKAKVWGANFFEHYESNEAISAASFVGRFVSNHTEYFLRFNVTGWGVVNGNFIQVVDPNGPNPVAIDTAHNVPLGMTHNVLIHVDPGYPERIVSFAAGSSAMNFSNHRDSLCQITPLIFKEIILAILPNGVKIVNHAEPNGMRIKRVRKDGELEFSHYIAGCYFEGGVNDSGQIGYTNGFRWTNMEPAAVSGKYSTVDVYEYDGDKDTVTKIRYEPDPQNNKDAKTVYEESSDLDRGVFLGGLRWCGSPQDKSDALRSVPLGSGCQTLQPFVPQDTSETMTSAAVFMPRSALTCYGIDGLQWSYGLAVSDFTGGLVSPGDRIIIEGSGIAGGSVGSKAATAAYGGWLVKEVDEGKIVFEATVGARFTDMADGFIVNGKAGAVQGELTYRNVCNFIGGAGQVSGPVKSDIVPMLMLLLGD